MKRLIKSSTNTVNIPARIDAIEAADDDTTEEAADTLEDKIKSAEDDFDYVLSGIDQLDAVQANEILNRLHGTLQDFIKDIADQLSA